jgi:hypothetical protein
MISAMHPPERYLATQWKEREAARRQQLQARLSAGAGDIYNIESVIDEILAGRMDN